MKRLIFLLSLVVGVWMWSPAFDGQTSNWSTNTAKAKNDKIKKVKVDKGKGGAVPELDPSAAGGAMVLLLGGMAWIASRRRTEDLG